MYLLHGERTTAAMIVHHTYTLYCFALYNSLSSPPNIRDVINLHIHVVIYML